MEVSPQLKQLLAAPKSIRSEDYIDRLSEYLMTFELESIEDILLMQIQGQKHDFSLEVHYTDLADFDQDLGYVIIHHPALLMPCFNNALYKVQADVVAHSSFVKKHHRTGTAKKKSQIRLVGLPVTDKKFTKSSIGALRSDEVDRFVQFTGTIVRSGAVKLLDLAKEYRCQTCGHCIGVTADPEQDNMIPQPRFCPNVREKRYQGETRSAVCGSNNLREEESSRRCVDYQEIKVCRLLKSSCTYQKGIIY